MKTSGRLWLVFGSLAATCAQILPHDEWAVIKREIIQESSLLDTYDYVIAGGGLAGLVLASRLSANSDTTVLVLEAGLSGNEVAERINTPQGAFYASIVGSDYDWKHVTQPQPNMNGRSNSWPRGRILGGSSAMNAMYVVRPSQVEINAWQQVISSENSSAAARWGWDEMYTAMRRAENFTEPLPDVARVGNIQWNASTHGSGGPMSISYPGVMMEIVGNWTNVLNMVGVQTQPSPNGGVTMGGFVTPSNINPTNWTRSYSRSAYIDSLPPRSNLHILPESTVTRVLFREQASTDGWIADRVEFAHDAGSDRRTVNVRREVILTGGSLGSPKILLHSGVGPRDMLESASVSMIEELPGVGQRLLDHLTAGLVWESRLETTGDLRNQNSEFSNSTQFRSLINDAVAFVNATTLFGGPDGANAFKQEILRGLQNATALLPTSDSEIIEGYRVTYNILANEFYDNTAQIELLLNLVSPRQVSIQAALQHPLSQGRLWINSSNPFDPVVIDPNYFSHPADVVTLRQGVKFVRTVGMAFGAAFGDEISPGTDVQSDEDWENWLRNSSAGTQYHPSSSCAMLPRAQGGVVDSRLRVYGTANVRIADSSVFPFEFAAHLASATYGLAEQAAVIIQEQSYNVPNSAKPLIDPFSGTVFCSLFAACAGAAVQLII